MSNRQTLYLLMALTVLVAVGRFWAAGRLDDYENGIRLHEATYRDIHVLVHELNTRRPRAVVTEDESGVMSHFQRQAQTARIGVVKVTSRPRAHRNFRDVTYTIDFEDGPPRLTREQIATFLFNATMPSHMPRMRTTALAMTPASSEPRQRAIPSGQERRDVWRITKLEFTRRTPTAAAN